MNLKKLSLRYKLLAALTLIPLIGLTLFLLLAVNIFEKDKIAYIFDSSLSVSKTRATRVSSEIASVVSLSQAVVLSYRDDTKDLAETGKYYFDREAKFQQMQIYGLATDMNGYEKTVDLAKPGKTMSEDAEAWLMDLVQTTKKKTVVVWREPKSGTVWIGARFGNEDDPKHVIALTRFDADELEAVFSDRSSMTFLIHKMGTTPPVFASKVEVEKDWNAQQIWRGLNVTTPEGIAELKSPSGGEYLASFVDTGVGGLAVVSMVDRKEALAAVDFLLRKSVLFFIAVISATAILAVLAARGLTRSLSKLSFATQKIAGGDFGVRVDIKSGGEIGVLAKSFNAMAEEVSRLMKETAEKARMESELATAKAVQETLFPKTHADLGPVSVSGHYMPASECGGDWWYYCENGDKVYIWIGDATGHGAPAALLTSAARAVASVINHGPTRSPSEALGILNRAICETSKGKMMMTFFLACIDKTTGEMSYSNASHEPPLLLKAGVEDPGRDDFQPLIEVNSPRLGDKIENEFKEATIQLDPGDRIVFYTDGVIDVKNPESKNWGERRFIKSLSAELPQSPSTNQALGAVVETLEGFRSQTALDDDVTLVLCSYRGAA